MKCYLHTNPFIAPALVAIALLGSWGCNRAPKPEEAHKRLVGQWRLVVKSDCKHWGVDSDTLILHSDGRMEQHLKLLNGKKYDSAQEHWEYSADLHIVLDQRLRVSVPEVLIVEFSDPPVIVLNPDGNCFYERFSSEE